jgi:hypothetical protein
MRNENVSQDDPERDQQIHEKLPGDWYNYEATEITMDTQEFDHWLSRLEDSLRVPITQSPA